ncbi:MAG: hypothetical protein KDK90_24815 [Leptospiraceae bacterium]|nr:hypothetical protein [Leptospiraceae bacterium]
MKANLLKTIIIIFILSFTQSINSFPGDHNSLTCTDRLYVASDTEYANADKLKDALASEDSETVKKAREYVKRNLGTIKTQIRNHHDFGVDITMWGDSLTDWVDHYAAPPDAFIPISDKDYGNENGVMDSWEDYFTVFGGAFADPFTVKNYATAMHKTTDLLGRINTSVGHIDGIWDVLPDRNHCIQEQMVGIGRGEFMKDPSSPRSGLMIGGNDVMMQAAFFPFLDKYKVEQTLENITFIIDWNIENGKQVLLEGTLPGYTEPLYLPYDSNLVNRISICSPIEDSLIEPDEIPWWICVYSPGTCRMMIEAALTHNANVIKAFSDFNHSVFAGPYLSKDGPRYPGRGEILMTMTSINQACINDRLTSAIGPSYEAVYPNNVKVFTLYNHFNATGIDMFAQNFWVPKVGMFGKHPDYNEPPKDIIHIGPHGYGLWGSLIGSKLVSLGWNKTTSASEMPDPVVELDGGGPGKKIRQKSIAVNLFGKESGSLNAISSNWDPYKGNKYGGFYREYWNNDRIYIQQIANAAPGVQMKDLYGEAYHLYGVLLKKYLEIGSMSVLGFPMSDVLNVGPAGTLRRIYFECGYMTHNTLDSSNRENYSIGGSEACSVFNDNNLDFENCLTDGECVGRWFEDYVFQLKPKGGHFPFKWEMTENNSGFPGMLDRVGRLRGGPTNNSTGSWVVKVRMTDATGETKEHDVYIKTGW